MTKKWRVALICVALVAASCGSDPTEEAADATDTTVASTTTTTTTDTAVASESTETESSLSDEERPDGFGEACSAAQLPTADQLAVSADGGLRARALPGDGDVVALIPDGTVIDTFSEPTDCGVLEDGSVWFQVGSPLLATGGWVHSGFLEAAGDVGAADDAAAGDDAETDDAATPAVGVACTAAQLPNADQLVVNAGNGLRARQLPGNGDIIDTLPTGTIVDTSSEADQCTVIDGVAWFEIETAALTTGGWVHSGFLDPIDE